MSLACKAPRTTADVASPAFGCQNFRRVNLLVLLFVFGSVRDSALQVIAETPDGSLEQRPQQNQTTKLLKLL